MKAIIPERGGPTKDIYMPYFDEQYSQVALPVEIDGKGLRRAQLGAIHSIAGHFALGRKPALVVMPTGSGKTAVLMTAAYLLRPVRVLVITPSRLVRDQMTTQFKDLTLLKSLGVLPGNAAHPRVMEVKEKMDSTEAWETCRDYDVVVATPNSASPAIDGIPLPPEDLFDLILIDEAHHSPARTWDELFRSFPRAKRLLVTATPFRRDRREISGRVVFEYPLAEAHRDGIFGDITYIPVMGDEENEDIATAKRAMEVFRADQAAGLKHYLMVRTDSRLRANDLLDLYEKHTDLKLRVIHSDHSFARIKKSIDDLRSGAIDGVVCVNMMGEGFDFPNLKIAAIHSPHKSLAVTLQFIGRFARTNAEGIGTAKFIATPKSVEIESERLYEEDSVWQEIVSNLSQTRVDEELFIRETIEGFENTEQAEIELEDLSLFSLRPYFHVKVYRMTGTVSLLPDPVLPKSFQVCQRWDNTELNSVVMIVRDVTRPKWTTTDHFLSENFHLLVLYYDSDKKLLFVNSTATKQAEIYQTIADSLTTGSARILPLNQINRVLNTMDNPEFYNIGMRNRLQSESSESYRIITGPSADKTLTESDGQLYHRGHVFGGDENETIGFSSGSKVWSNTRSQIPNLIKWCQVLSDRLAIEGTVVTGSHLDHLDVGVSVNEIPEGVIGSLWDVDTFKRPPFVSLRLADGSTEQVCLVDFDLVVDQAESNTNRIRLDLINERRSVALDFVLDEDGHRFEVTDPDQLDGIFIERAHTEANLLEYLNANPPSFFFSDFSMLFGSEHFPSPCDLHPSIEDDQFRIIDWVANMVDVKREFGPVEGGLKSIHNYLEEALLNQCAVGFYDHGSGEAADFISFDVVGDSLQITLYHCKSSSGDDPSNRVKDFYEVCQQVVKSLKWIENNEKLLKNIKRRNKLPRKFIKGDLPGLEKLLNDMRRSKIVYKLVVVQPGISKEAVGELGPVLASAANYVQKSRGQSFEVWCSA